MLKQTGLLLSAHSACGGKTGDELTVTHAMLTYSVEHKRSLPLRWTTDKIMLTCAAAAAQHVLPELPCAAR